MNEEKKSARFHVNLFDVVLILLAVLCVIGIWQRNNLQRMFESEQETDVYAVSFEIRNLRDTSVQYLAPGTALYVISGEERISLGTIAGEVAVVDASDFLPTVNEQGETVYVQAYYPDDLSTVKAVLDTHGLEHNGAFLVEGVYTLATNQTVVAYTENAVFEICITAIVKA